MSKKATYPLNLILLSCCLILGSIPADAQFGIPKSDTAKATSLYSEAKKLADAGQYLDAVSRIQASLNISQSKELHQLSALNYSLLGKISSEVNDWENTLKYYLRSASQFDTIHFYDEEADIFGILGEKYYSFKAYNLAAGYQSQSFRLTSPDNKNKRALRAESTALTLSMMELTDSALNWYEHAAQLYQENSDENGYIRTLFGKARIYTGEQRFDSALNYYLEAGNLLQDRESAEEKIMLFNNIAFLWFRQKNYGFARDAFNKVLSIQLNNPDLSGESVRTYINLAICSQNQHQQDSSVYYLGKAVSAAEEAGRWEDKAEAEHTLALIYHNENDPYHAGFYCEKCIESAKKGSDLHILEDCYMTYSKLLEEGNDFVHALEYYEKHLDIRDSLMFVDKMKEQDQVKLNQSLEATEQKLRLSIADEERKDLMLKNLRSQAENREKELRLANSEKELERSEKNRLKQAMDLDKVKYQKEMKEKEVKALEQDKEIQAYKLRTKENEEKALIRQNELLESEKRQQILEADKQREAKKRARWTAGLSILIVFIVLSSLLSARRRNAILRKQKQLIEEKNLDLAQKNEEITTQNEQIVLQKSIIEQKNISITDSIQYASRIQRAVLPSIAFLGEMDLEHFIFFRPKDIVSGDFYWGDQKDSLLSFAAVDCTGHGVPGAFMSMLGSTFLNEIAANEFISDAAEMLNRLREQVIHALKQKGESGEAQDGMDIALCIYDSLSGKLSFAGANNPLYLIRNNELQIFPGDKMPIGIHRAGDIPFTSHTIEIRKGDRMYLFSDGYADQFGGTDGKKMKYKPFRELLLRISPKPMDVQKKLLEKAFDNWKGLLEQVDDVLVIGISF